MLKLPWHAFLMGSGILGILLIPSPSYGGGSQLDTLEETAVTQSPIDNGSTEVIKQDDSENNSLTVLVNSANNNTSGEIVPINLDTSFTGENKLKTRLNIPCLPAFPPDI